MAKPNALPTLAQVNERIREATTKRDVDGNPLFGWDYPIERESDRWAMNGPAHTIPERMMSGDLPDQPIGLAVDAAPGNRAPWRGMRSR